MSTHSTRTQSMVSFLFHTCAAWNSHFGVHQALGSFCGNFVAFLQTSISQDDLTHADKLLVQFCKQFSSLYGTYKALCYTLSMELCLLPSLFLSKKHVSKCPPTASLHWQCKIPWPFVGTQYLFILKCEWNVSESLPWQLHSWCAGASLTKA